MTVGAGLAPAPDPTPACPMKKGRGIVRRVGASPTPTSRNIIIFNFK